MKCNRPFITRFKQNKYTFAWTHASVLNCQKKTKCIYIRDMLHSWREFYVFGGFIIIVIFVFLTHTQRHQFFVKNSHVIKKFRVTNASGVRKHSVKIPFGGLSQKRNANDKKNNIFVTYCCCRLLLWLSRDGLPRIKRESTLDLIVTES